MLSSDLIKRVLLFSGLAFIVALLASCASLDTSTPIAPTPTLHRVSTLVINPIGDTNVEAAHTQLEEQGERAVLVLVSSDGPDAQGIIYWDLQARNIRATTGPDEGIETKTVSCYPECVFVRQEDANSLSTVTWVAVLRHEYRHIEQARNNPNMAHDFRAPDGRFTPYAAFQEACADYGINVKESYHAQERIDALKGTLGTELQGVLDQACKGQPWAYRMIVGQYNIKRADDGAFNALFPPYD